MYRALNNMLYPLLGLCLVLCSCDSAPQTDPDVIAHVGPFSLTKSELPAHLQQMDLASEEVTRWAKHWARDKAFEIEAIRQLRDTESLDQMTEAYRSSLRRHLFEQQLFDAMLDTSISTDRLQAFYEANKEQYILESSIYRLHYIQLTKDHPSIPEVQRMWDSPRDSMMHDSLILLAHDVAEVFLLDEVNWYSKEDLATVMPDKMLKQLEDATFKDRRLVGDTSLYLLRVFERFADTEVPPLSFIEQQARQVILFQKKQQLLRDQKERIYQEAVKRNRVKFIQ